MQWDHFRPRGRLLLARAIVGLVDRYLVVRMYTLTLPARRLEWDEEAGIRRGGRRSPLGRSAAKTFPQRMQRRCDADASTRGYWKSGSDHCG